MATTTKNKPKASVPARAAAPAQRTQTPPKPQAQRAAPPTPRDEPRQDVALMDENVAAAAAQYAGAGISDRAEDNIVPLIYLLQTNSKPAMSGHERYIPGASGGCIWLRNLPNEIAVVDGQEGFVFQPCAMNVCWIEWLPDRGGFVARHPDRPAEAELRVVEKEGREVRQWTMPNENVVQETREFAGFVHGVTEEPLPYVLPLTGTGHTVGKMWMTQMRQEKLPGGQRAPLFANLYRIKTKLMSKNNWSWYQYDISKEGAVQTVEDIQRGAAFHDAFQSGEKQAAGVEDIGGEGGESGEGGEQPGDEQI